MSIITIEKAVIEDADKLTKIMKKTFDEEAKKWLAGQTGVVDYNIQPPGYASIEMTKYMIEELEYFRVKYKDKIVGGIILTITGTSFGRIDRIFVDPEYQGKGIGSSVIKIIEEEFSMVRTWDLETSSRQINNHYFYEKLGYKTTFETEDEYCYIKRKGSLSAQKGKDISNIQYENCNLERTECYQVNLEGSSLSNSNLANTHISNCNLSHSKFQNINLTHSLYADLNLSYSTMKLVTLGGVCFIDTNLGEDEQPVSFERCDLKGTKISNSNLKNVEIKDSEITGMKINDISVEKLLEAYYQVNKE